MILPLFTIIIKNAFSSLFFRKQKLQGFSRDRKILMLFFECFFIYKTVSQISEILIFNQDIWGSVHYVLEINLISSGILIRKTNSQAKQTKRNLRHGFVDEKQLNTIMPNQTLPWIYLVPFLLFKATAFLQIFFPKDLLFRQVLRTLVFLSSKYLIFFYLFIFFY